MSESPDPRLAATVRWVFLFIRHEIHRGRSLSEIEFQLGKAVHEGQLNQFIKLFDRQVKDAAINGPKYD